MLEMGDAEFQRRGMIMIPAFAAAVGVIYNLDDVRPPSPTHLQRRAWSRGCGLVQREARK